MISFSIAIIENDCQLAVESCKLFIDSHFLIKSLKSLEQMKKVRIINIRTEESEEYWRKWILGEVFLFSRAVLFVCLVYHSHFKIDTFFLLSEEISFVP